MAGSPKNTTGSPEQFTAIKFKSNQLEQVEKLK